MNVMRCWYCDAYFTEDMEKCPSCSISQKDQRSILIKQFKNKKTDRKTTFLVNALREAEKHPSETVACSKCEISFPNRLSNCPVCGKKNREVRKINTPIYDVRVSKTYSKNNATNTAKLVLCSVCGEHISEHAETCPHCGHFTGVHVCPKCGSVNTKVISDMSKAVSIFTFGIYAANKVKSTYQCTDCNCKF